jgi:hypothetical protein
MIKKYLTLLLIITSITSRAQLLCSEAMITTPDTTVCKGEPVTLKALKRQNRYSVRFDGINDYIAVLNNSSINIDTAFTIECWYKPDTLGFYYLVSKGPDTTIGWYALGRYPDFVGNSYFGGLRAQNSPYPQPMNIITGPNMNPAFGQWVHLCYTGNNTIRRLYINGVLEIETSGTISFGQNNYSLNIGRHQHTAYPYYTRGWMDELRIWKRSLSQQEIVDKMYRQLKAAEENKLSVYFDFNQGSGFIVSDKSGNNNFGSMLNGVQWSTDVPFTYYSNDYTYQWSTGDTTQTITYNIPSSVVVSIIVTDGNIVCYDTVQVNVFAGPTITTTALSFCDGDSATLTASEGLSYLWNNGDTTQSITVYESGQFQVEVNDLNGCNSPSNILNVVMNNNPAPVVNSSGSTLFCSGESVTLSTGNYQNYQWSNGSTSSAIDISNSGTFSVTVTDVNGCTGVSSGLDVSVVPAVNTSSIIGPVNVNAFQSYSYTVTQNTGNTYNWSAANGAIISGQGTNSVNVIWNDNATGQLMVVESNGVCNDTSYLNVSIINAVQTLHQIPARIYPNPCSKHLYIDGLAAGKRYRISIQDLSGRNIKYLETFADVSIDVSALSSGSFLLYIANEQNQQSIFKFIKNE